jgi:hypothetical protein
MSTTPIFLKKELKQVKTYELQKGGSYTKEAYIRINILVKRGF